MVIRQQEELEQQRFGFQPKRGRPKPPEKLTDESETWLKEWGNSHRTKENKSSKANREHSQKFILFATKRGIKNVTLVMVVNHFLVCHKTYYRKCNTGYGCNHFLVCHKPDYRKCNTGYGCTSFSCLLSLRKENDYTLNTPSLCFYVKHDCPCQRVKKEEKKKKKKLSLGTVPVISK